MVCLASPQSPIRDFFFISSNIFFSSFYSFVYDAVVTLFDPSIFFTIIEWQTSRHSISAFPFVQFALWRPVNDKIPSNSFMLVINAFVRHQDDEKFDENKSSFDHLLFCWKFFFSAHFPFSMSITIFLLIVLVVVASFSISRDEIFMLFSCEKSHSVDRPPSSSSHLRFRIQATFEFYW